MPTKIYFLKMIRKRPNMGIKRNFKKFLDKLPKNKNSKILIAIDFFKSKIEKNGL
jgi:hypothetical protein